MLWRRYRRIVVTSVPVAALIGAFLALALYLGANPDYREQGGWSAFVSLAATGAVVGALTSLPAVLGAAAALTFRDRSLARAPQARVLIGGLGAAVGALVCWTAVATFASVMSPDGGSWFPLYEAVAAGASVISGIAAAVLIGWTESRVESAESPAAAANL